VRRRTTPAVSADEVRRYRYQWFVLDIAFGKPEGWAPGRLERMWMAQGEGGQRQFVIRPCSSSWPSRPATTAPTTNGFRPPACCARSCWRRVGVVAAGMKAQRLAPSVRYQIAD
jgi:hypothetical protein